MSKGYKLTFEQLMEKRIRMLNGEIHTLKQQLEARERKIKELQKEMLSSGYHYNAQFKKRVRENGLDAFHFAFNREDFDKFVEKIDVRPNEYFKNIIEEVIK